MSALESFLKILSQAKGLQHVAELRGLRIYIKMSTDEEIINAIQRIDNPFYLRLLIEAGMRKALLDAVQKRAQQLVGRPL